MKRIFTILLLALSITFLFNGCTQEEKSPKYIFFFIGDGFGLAQLQLTESYLGAYNSVYPETKLHLTGLPEKGFITTYSSSHKITDSAAAGTALATGKKTSNGRICKNEDATQSYKSVAYAAKEQGMKVGIITTVSLDHATPAVYYANVDTRNMYYEISMQLPTSGFDYFAGGGFRNPQGLATKHAYSENYSQQNQGGEEVEGKKDMFEFARENGYTLVSGKEEILSLPSESSKIIAMNPVIQSGAAMPYAIDQTDESLTLADFVQKGIEILDNKNGFFMMVEGGKIDWACHANDGATVIKEVIDFDNAISKAINFYLEHPDETLIVVSGDHETGGLSMGNTLTGKEADYSLFKYQKASLEVFEKQIRSLEAPGYDSIMTLVANNYGLGNEIPLTEYDIHRFKAAYNQSFGTKLASTFPEMDYTTYGGYDPITITATHILSEKAGVAWTTYSHTASPLPVHSIGACAANFGGFYDNTDIPKKIMKLIDYPFPN